MFTYQLYICVDFALLKLHEMQLLAQGSISCVMLNVMVRCPSHMRNQIYATDVAASILVITDGSVALLQIAGVCSWEVMVPGSMLVVA